MKLLVTLESQRHVLLTAPTATAQELRDKACAEAGVDPMQYELIFSRMAVRLQLAILEHACTRYAHSHPNALATPSPHSRHTLATLSRHTLAQVPLERSLAELGIQDRERLELRARTSRAQSGSAEVERVVLSLSASSAQLDAYESTLGVGEPPHQELFTRVLEALDGIKLDG